MEDVRRFTAPDIRSPYLALVRAMPALSPPACTIVRAMVQAYDKALFGGGSVLAGLRAVFRCGHVGFAQTAVLTEPHPRMPAEVLVLMTRFQETFRLHPHAHLALARDALASLALPARTAPCSPLGEKPPHLPAEHGRMRAARRLKPSDRTRSLVAFITIDRNPPYQNRCTCNASSRQTTSPRCAPSCSACRRRPSHTRTTDPDDDHATTPGAMERRLRGMLATPVDLAIKHGSPVLADHLKASIPRHSSANVTADVLKMVEDAARLAVATPEASHGTGMWFRPMAARHLKGRSIATLDDPVAYCNAHGGSWWCSVPRIGAGRPADRGVAAPPRGLDRPAGRGRRRSRRSARRGRRGPHRGRRRAGPRSRRAPRGSERVQRHHRVPPLPGTRQSGRDPRLPASLREQPKTLRAYTKELERFLQQAVMVRGKALRSLFVDDCEAYRDFLKHPSFAFVGPRAPRSSRRWRPFVAVSLGPESQLYAIRALRPAFTWLVDARYLASDRWKLVTTP